MLRLSQIPYNAQLYKAKLHRKQAELCQLIYVKLHVFTFGVAIRSTFDKMLSSDLGQILKSAGNLCINGNFEKMII